MHSERSMDQLVINSLDGVDALEKQRMTLFDHFRASLQIKSLTLI